MTTNLNQPGYGKARRGKGRRGKAESLPRDKKIKPPFVDNYNFEAPSMWGPTLPRAMRDLTPEFLPPRTRSAGVTRPARSGRVDT